MFGYVRVRSLYYVHAYVVPDLFLFLVSINIRAESVDQKKHNNHQTLLFLQI